MSWCRLVCEHYRKSKVEICEVAPDAGYGVKLWVRYLVDLAVLKDPNRTCGTKPLKKGL